MTQKFLRDDGTFAPLASSGSSGSGPITLITKSTTADVTLNSSSTYFDGPSVALGTSGTWFASGTVTILPGAANVWGLAKLWDGTTVVAAGAYNGIGNMITSFSLSGVISSPAANLKISVLPAQVATMVFNFSGTGKDSTLTAIRIG